MRTAGGALLALVLSSTAAPALAEELVAFWGEDWKEAKRRAAAEGRPLLVDFAAEWCGPCKAMDEKFWPRDDVRAAAERFVRVQLDFDRPNEASRRFWITSIPAVLVLDPWSNLLGREIGYGGARKHLELLAKVPADFAPVADDSLAAAEERADGTALLRLGEHYIALGLPSASNFFLEQALAAKDLKSESSRRADALVAVGLNHLMLGDAEKARRALEKAFDSGDGPGRADEGLFGLVVAWCRLGKAKRAEKALDELRRRYPASPAVAAGDKFLASSCGG